MDKVSAHTYAVILAGGSGTRFWPKSRRTTPKQLCAIGDATTTMIELTLARLDGFIPPERRLIVTHRDQVDLTRQLVGERCPRILAEPQARNTSAALALAALEIAAIAGNGQEAVMISLHADHIINDLAAFHATLLRAEQVALTDRLTLLGLTPQYPETGFGYIERGEALAGHKGAYEVRTFCEKPSLAVAKEYVASGKFYWNSGLFVWKVGVLLGEFDRYLPSIKEPLAKALAQYGGSFAAMSPETLAPTYQRLPKIAIDHGILEVSDRVAVVEASFDWKDVGSWDALSQCFSPDPEGNLAYGDVLLLESSDTTVDSDGPFVAALGLTGMIVVVAKGAVLVCPKDRSQDVKKIVEELAERGRQELL